MTGARDRNIGNILCKKKTGAVTLHVVCAITCSSRQCTVATEGPLRPCIVTTGGPLALCTCMFPSKDYDAQMLYDGGAY